MKPNTQGHPYDIFPALETLKTRRHSLDAETMAALKIQVALNAMDPRAVAMYADLSGDDWAHLYPPQAPVKSPDTDQAIDIFLDTYGTADTHETELLERLIFNPTPDYASVLAAQEDAAAENRGENSAGADLTDSLISGFLQDHPATPAEVVTPGQPVAKETAQTDIHHITQLQTAQPGQAQTAPPEPPDITSSSQTSAPETHNAPTHVAPAASSLAESLAKSYIKQGRYQRAFEIISGLSLNNPEKSVYFADQLRFLRKLMDIEQSRRSSAKADS